MKAIAQMTVLEKFAMGMQADGFDESEDLSASATFQVYQNTR